MILTTTPTVEGHTVTDYRGIAEKAQALETISLEGSVG